MNLSDFLDEVDEHFEPNLTPLARELLNAGRWSPWPPGVRRQRVLTALGVGLAVGTTKKLSLAAMTTWSKVVAVGCVVCAGAGGVVAYRAATNDATAAAVTTVVTSGTYSEPGIALRDVQVKANETASADEPRVAALESDHSPESRSESGRGSAVRLAAAKPERKDSRVRAELTLLEQARSELRSGRSEAAVVTLQAYSQRFPRGVLGLEAEVLRIEALAAAGRTQEAAKRAQRVLERNPNSVVASRLKRFEAPR